MDSIVELTILGIDALLLPLLFYSYRKDSRKIKSIEAAPEIDLNDSKANKSLEKVTDYAIISGDVQPKNSDLQSNYRMKERGVIKVLSIRQHGTTWRPDFNSDYAKKISQTVNSVPFYLVNKKTNTKIEVINGSQADCIVKELETTYKHYEPLNQSLLSAIFTSLISNEVPTGVEVTERMLKNGTFIYAYGRLEKINDNMYFLSRPANTDFPFILTKHDRQTVVADLKASKSALKVCLIIFGTIGLVTGAYLFYKKYKSYKEHQLRQKMAADLRVERLKSQRERMQAYETDRTLNESNSGNNEQTCVLCLVNPREVILLDCGHICLCIDCLDRINNQKCPICRQTYQSFARCYIP